MSRRFSTLLLCLSLPLSGPPRAAAVLGQEPEPMAGRSTLVALRGAAAELSKLGDEAALRRLHQVLIDLGDDPEALARLDERWEKDLARASNGRSAASALRKLHGAVEDLVAELDTIAGTRRARLAELVLALDSEEPRANEALGRERRDGLWLTPEEIGWRRGRERVADMLRAASRMRLNVETGTSDSPVLLATGGGQGSMASAHGVTVHARMQPDKLARILRQALRGAALSSVLLTGELRVPALARAHTIVLTDSEASYSAALREALANGGLSEDEHREQLDQRMRSFQDHRGWRTSRWRTEAEHESLVLWDIIDEWLGLDAQPCLVAGHLNWVALELLGTSMPSVAWKELTEGGPARTSASPQAPFQAEALWRSSRRSLYGCRSWMVQRVQEHRDPPWSRAMVDHVGKISDEVLLKTTLVVGYLQERGELASVLAATRAKTDRVAAFEAALGEPLPAFEERWARWLVGERPPPAGIVQSLERGASAGAGAEPDDGGLLQRLNALRGRALAGQPVELPPVALDPELSAGALAHARYLVLHEDQRDAWPGAHEERADREGFSAAGSRAGLHGVIAYTEDARSALDQWMGSFYHRLPLLSPGLFGVGLGRADGVFVLDVTSLVAEPWGEHWVAWPYDGMRDVPLSFQPEIPSPVPGAELASLGYPVTLQVVLPGHGSDARMSLRLFAGGPDGAEVPCHVISPDEPLFPELAPERAWCSIPEAALEPGTTYYAVAECLDPPKELTWSFTTAER